MEKSLVDTARLCIRPLRVSDGDDFYRYRSNPDVCRYQGFDVYSREEAQAFIENQSGKILSVSGGWVQYGIELKSTGRLIGDCALKLEGRGGAETGVIEKLNNRVEPGKGGVEAEIGITISHLEQRKGYGKEAIVGLVNFLFDSVGVRRIVETVDAENEASIQLLKAARFRQEGHFIENIFFKGKWGSELQFALLKREWEERR